MTYTKDDVRFDVFGKDRPKGPKENWLSEAYSF